MINQVSPKIIIAVTGASGSIYAKRLINKFSEIVSSKQITTVGLVFSDSAKEVWKHELGEFETQNFNLPVYSNKSFDAPFASGSANYNVMIICPCSMGTLARISSGISNDLITRSADVILKERGKLIAVVRETPYNLIHIQNMQNITLAGGIIFPASPSFYNQPTTIEELIDSVVDRVIRLAGIDIEIKEWGK